MNSSTSKIKDYYDDYGTWYDQERGSKYYSLINALEIDLVKKYAMNKQVLEVGCGTGIILDEVSKFAGKAAGIDLSDGMLEKARKKGLDVRQADATKIPFEDASFDLVYSFKVLPHVLNIRAALLELERVVRDDGILILEFYNPYSIKFVVNHLSGLLKKKVYIRYDTLARIRKYLPPGWRIIAIRGVRIFTPCSFIHRIPVVSRLFYLLEKVFCDSPLKYFGGYFVVVLDKSAAKERAGR